MITDTALAAPRGVASVIEEALAAGAPAVQLREKKCSARELLPLAQRLRAMTREAGARLFLNDRLDLALAVEADGVHLGPDDLPVSAVRAVTPSGFLIGYSTDDPSDAREAVANGADYIGCGAVWSTHSKTDAGSAIGLEGLVRVVNAVSVPVVGIGGITLERAPRVAETGAAGVAVIGAVMAAAEPGSAVRALMRAFP